MMLVERARAKINLTLCRLDTASVIRSRATGKAISSRTTRLSTFSSPCPLAGSRICRRRILSQSSS